MSWLLKWIAPMGATRLEQFKREKWIGPNRRGPKANHTVLPGL